MDPHRFDALTTGLATAGASRRRLLRGLGGGLLAAVLGGGGAAADTACKPSGNLPQSKCRHAAQCCSGVCHQGECCTPLTTCPPAQCGHTIDDGCGGTLACPACCAAGSCSSGTPVCQFVPHGCSTNPDCNCTQNVEGATVCADVYQDCNAFSPCSSSADCPAGQSCLDVFCACGPNLPRMCFPCCAG